MKPDFSHASEAFKRLNPHLFGAVGGLGATQRERHSTQALERCGQTRESSPPRLVVCIVGFRRRILDDDNFCAGCKPLRDAIAFSLGRGPAFPFISGIDDDETHYSGMSLRDWFAGMAMQGILANEKLTPVTGLIIAEMSIRADAAYDYADAMLAERSK